MQIIAHRGFWQNPKNPHQPNLNPQNLLHLPKSQNLQNRLQSFECAFLQGFGIETDLRDLCTNLVISHDMPTSSATKLEELFTLYNRLNSTQTLALNIKADGLGEVLLNLIMAHKITHYFCFDMSVPEMRKFAHLGLRFFTRQSEIERDLPLFSEADGVWCDEFYESWISENVILGHLQKGKQIAIVSPELHGREYLSRWEYYKQIIASNALQENLMLCTDFPQIAREFFA